MQKSRKTEDFIGSKHFTFLLFPVPSNNYISHHKTLFLKVSQSILHRPYWGILLLVFPTFVLSGGHVNFFQRLHNVCYHNRLNATAATHTCSHLLFTTDTIEIAKNTKKKLPLFYFSFRRVVIFQ